MYSALVKTSLAVMLTTFCTVSNAAEIGWASYYSDKFHGRHTANGERYDREGLTAVHPCLPFGTIIKVTNLRNHHSVHLRINDRRRFHHGRLLDVSKRAARELGFVGAGLAKVAVEVVSDDDS
jgi:rare lipoprotein A